MTLRTSHENPEILEVYKTFYGKPLSELAEKMLHTTYQDRSELLHRKEEKPVKKWRCTICGYIHEGEPCRRTYLSHLHAARLCL